jgi:hypothetical protein
MENRLKTFKTHKKEPATHQGVHFNSSFFYSNVGWLVVLIPLCLNQMFSKCHNRVLSLYSFAIYLLVE